MRLSPTRRYSQPRRHGIDLPHGQSDVDFTNSPGWLSDWSNDQLDPPLVPGRP